MKTKFIFSVLISLLSFNANAFETQDDMNEFGAKLAGYYLANYVTDGQEKKVEKMIWFVFEDYLKDEKQALKEVSSTRYYSHQSTYEARPSLSLKTNRVMLRLKIKF